METRLRLGIRFVVDVEVEFRSGSTCTSLTLHLSINANFIVECSEHYSEAGARVRHIRKYEGQLCHDEWRWPKTRRINNSLEVPDECQMRNMARTLVSGATCAAGLMNVRTISLAIYDLMRMNADINA